MTNTIKTHGVEVEANTAEVFATLANTHDYLNNLIDSYGRLARSHERTGFVQAAVVYDLVTEDLRKALTVLEDTPIFDIVGLDVPQEPLVYTVVPTH